MDDSNWDWSNYYKIKNQSTPPRETLVRAIELFNSRNKSDREKVAIDLGCGSGRDTIELLMHGWSVLAIDFQEEAISTLQAACPQPLQNRLKTQVSSFEALKSLPSSQLINASYSIYFTSPDKFYPLWELIVNTLQPGDLFAGTLLGLNDDWNRSKRTDMTFLSTKELDNLLAPFKIEMFEELESDEIHGGAGGMKHWHRYCIVAEKR